MVCVAHSASSRWSLSLYSAMRISEQMTIGKTHSTLDLRQKFKILPFFFDSQIEWFLRINKRKTLIDPSVSRIVSMRSVLTQIISRSVLSLAGPKGFILTWKDESEIGITCHSWISWISWSSSAWFFRNSWALHQRILENILLCLPLVLYRWKNRNHVARFENISAKSRHSTSGYFQLFFWSVTLLRFWSSSRSELSVCQSSKSSQSPALRF